MACLLSTYQLWLDDLFPKAKFADGINIIEKLGHKKQIQIMRKVWIDEGKYKPPASEDSDSDHDGDYNMAEDRDAADEMHHSATGQEVSRDDDSGAGNGRIGRGLYSAPLPNPTTTEVFSEGRDGAEPDEDELDALLAEDLESTRGPSKPKPRVIESSDAPPEPDEFADEMEAMAEMDPMW